jgi:hypothetical protein
MYRILILISLFTFGYVFYLYLKNNSRNATSLKSFFTWKHLTSFCPGAGSNSNKNSTTVLNIIFCTSYLLGIASICLLVITGLLPVLITGKHLSGLFLIVHVTVAPVLVISATIWILFTVHKMRFDSDDLSAIKNLFSGVDEKSDFLYVYKIGFWMIFILIVLAIVSIILMMYPLFGADGQEKLLVTHRYSTLLLFFVFQYQIYLKLRSKQIINKK